MTHQRPQTLSAAALAYCAFLEHLEVQLPGPRCGFEHVQRAAHALVVAAPDSAAALMASLIWREIQSAHAAHRDGRSDARDFWPN